MTDTTNTNEPPAAPTLPTDEQRILDTALLDSDQLLARTLYSDQLRRRRRIAWSLILLCGGVAMTTLVWALMTGMFAVTTAPADIDQANQLSREGWQLWQQGNAIAAVEKFTQSVELNPKNADTWNGLGWSQFSSGDSLAAEKSFLQCVKLNARHPAGLNGLGQIYLMWKDYPQAEKFLKKAAPQASAAWYGLARLYLVQGDFQKAKPWAERFVEEDPANPQGQQMLQAAREGKLPEDLRIMLEPAGKPGGAESEDQGAETGQSKADLPEDEFSEWRTQLVAAGEDSRWYVGANFGMTLSALPGDEAFKILEPCWAEIADSVRPQILKGFTPGMKKKPGINDWFFDIMHLGYTDSDETVREFARVYINAITISHIADDSQVYEEWRDTWGKRTATEIALDECAKRIEELKTLPTGDVPDAMSRLSAAANDLREFKAMQEVAIKTGLFDVLDRWIAEGTISEDSAEYSHLIGNVPHP